MNYTYTALNAAGRRIGGNVEAASPEAAKASLRKSGYTVLDLRTAGALNRDIDLPFLGNPTSKDMAIFCRQFASILRAGVSFNQALSMLGQQTENKKLSAAIRTIQADLEKGSSLAASMRRLDKIFPPMLANMAAAGEESGNLDVVFTQMEAYFDKATKTRGAIKKAMTYPVLLLIVMVVVLFVMMTSIVPKFLETFASMDAELPAVTQAVVNVSDWMSRFWWLPALLIVALAVSVRFFSRTGRGKHFFGLLARKLPVLKGLTERSACATFCRTMSLLLGSGIDVLEALALTADNMRNIWYAEAVREVRGLVLRGMSLADALRSVRLFAPMLCNMVGIGETSGDLESMMEKTADYYDDEVKLATDRLLGLLEPAIILVMAGFVVIIVMAIFLPMLNMTQAYDQYLQ